MSQSAASDHNLLPKQAFGVLLDLLVSEGFEVIGPRIQEEAIVYGPVRTVEDLPVGWTDEQRPGSYRLARRQDRKLFGYAVGPHSWKRYLFPPTLELWQAQRTADGFTVEATLPEPPRRAFLGVRGCELHAIAVQDRVFLGRNGGNDPDPFYARARERTLLIAVECQDPAGTCFCTSMGTGPAIPGAAPVEGASKSGSSADAGVPPPPAVGGAAPPAGQTSLFDLALTELDDAFLVRAGSVRGRSLLDRLRLEPATPAQAADGRTRVAGAAATMGRRLDVTDIRALLHGNQEHPRWDDVASRCLACTNCTLVCPTCFCSRVEDVSDLTVEHATRTRAWDSCFDPEFARVHGGNFRPTIRGRYRQWLTHKFASWYDQFGVSGCVGCGRCITWCPVGIDVTEEITAIRATDARPGKGGGS